MGELGFGRCDYPNGDLYEGRWQANVREGMGKVRVVCCAAGVRVWLIRACARWLLLVCMEGGRGGLVFDEPSCVADEPSCVGMWAWDGGGWVVVQCTYANGDVYEGEWKNDKRHGNGKVGRRVCFAGACTSTPQPLPHNHGFAIGIGTLCRLSGCGWFGVCMCVWGLTGD